MVAPLRSAATRIGVCSSERPRLAAFPPRLRALRPRRRSPLQLDEYYRFRRLRRCRSQARGSGGAQEAMSRAERRAHRHPAPLGRGGHRLALAQRLTKIKPAFLLCAIGPAAFRSSASKLLRQSLQRKRRRPSVRPPPTDAPPQCGRRRASPKRSSIAAATAALGCRPASTASSSWRCFAVETVDLRQPRSKHPLIHRYPLSIHNKS